MKIAVAGTGYVGLSMATLLSQHHEVMAVDIVPEKVDKINCRISPIRDEYIEKYFVEKDLNLVATLDAEKHIKMLTLLSLPPLRIMIRRGTSLTRLRWKPLFNR